MSVKCAECHCAPVECASISKAQCQNCTLDVCCCLTVHQKPNSKFSLEMQQDYCAGGTCHDFSSVPMPRNAQQSIIQFFKNAKSLCAAALGIEILCIGAAETGENTGLYLLGFNHIGIPLAYAMGYGLAAFTTFATILGRYQYGSNSKVDSCCSVLEQDENKGFFSNVASTFKNFGVGLSKLRHLHEQSNMKQILKSSLVILVTAETACIVTAETVDLIFYRHYLYLSIPLALLVGAFTVVAPEAYRKLKRN